MKTKLRAVFAILFIIIGLYVFVTALSWDYFESKALPLFVSGLMFILGLNQLRIEIRNGSEMEAEENAEQKAANKLRWCRFGVVMSWIAGLIVGIYLLGFVIASLIFAFLYLKSHGRSYLRSTIFAAASMAFFYGVFVIGFKLILHEGLLYTLLFGYG